MIMNKQLIKASKEYLNTGECVRGDKGYDEVLPLVIFPYRMPVRKALACGFGIVSFIVPDGCLGLFIGNAIKNPISLKVRVVRACEDVCSSGVRVSIISLYHSKRVWFGRKVRKCVGLLIRRAL